MKKLKLQTSDDVVLVDNDDYEKVKNYKWYKAVRGDIVMWQSGHIIKLHRVILGLSKTDPRVDHKNRNPLDNRKENLRLCNARQNSANSLMSKTNTSGYKGVSWSKDHRKWVARIRDNGIYKCLGYFEHPLDAAKAYDKRAKEVYGEFYHSTINE